MTHPADLIVPAAKMTLALADQLVIGIDAAKFARKPTGVDANSPAFIFGHLAIYPDKLMEMLSMPGMEPPHEQFTELFDVGKECKDDPDGSIYPPMDQILERFKSRHETILAGLPNVDAETFGQETPMERMRDRFPTLGSFTNFLLCAHTMVHLGQLSTWRRCMGLGSCF